MHITRLSLSNFRLFTRLDIHIPESIVVAAGGNAQGKTTLLEAIYSLATFTSLNASQDRQMINLLEQENDPAVARIQAEIQRKDRIHQLEFRLILQRNGGIARLRKEVLLDGVKTSPVKAVGTFNAVVFTPQLIRIIENGPEERRRYLNLTLTQAVPGYGNALSGYTRALERRNALLKILNERGGDPNQLNYWDDLLSKYGALLIHARDQSVQEWMDLLQPHHGQLSGKHETASLWYKPVVAFRRAHHTQASLFEPEEVFRLPNTKDECTELLSQSYQATRQEDIRRGVTTTGPHRDDLRFMINQLDASDYGSRGQVRSILYALKLAELEWMTEKTGTSPVLLLDETLAELDDNRRLALQQALTRVDQAVLTTTDLHLFQEDFLQQAQIWTVNDGQVHPTD